MYRIELIKCSAILSKHLLLILKIDIFNNLNHFILIIY
jgi:hypothetical protein